MDGETASPRAAFGMGAAFTPLTLLASEGRDAASLQECPPADVANPALDLALQQQDEESAFEQRVLAPPPDTVVVGCCRGAFRAAEQVRVGEVMLLEEHATQVA